MLTLIFWLAAPAVVFAGLAYNWHPGFTALGVLTCAVLAVARRRA